MRLLPILVVTGLLASAPLAAWGRKGHRILAQLALQDLPPGPAAWFQGLSDIVVDHSSDPDEWKNDRDEGPRHFLDMDLYGDGVPVLLEEARARVGAKAFQKAGQLPWVIQDRVALLAKAFRAGDRQDVAFQASILSHYVGDLHVPLHTVENYDGKLTGQHGVHSRWETGLVDRMAGAPEVRPAALEPNTLQAIWPWLRASNALVPALLQDDKAADMTEGGPPARDARSSSPLRLPHSMPGPSPDMESSQASSSPRGLTEGYWLLFNQRQGPVVKEQLARAGQHTAELILLAWTMAGQPVAPH